MNILLIHCHYRLPGGEDAVFAAERAMLQRHGHQVVCYESTNEVRGLAKAALPLLTLWNPAAFAEVRRLIRRHRIDVVHVHNTLLRVSPSVLWAAKSMGVPVVQTLHNFRLFCPNGILMREGQVCEDCPHGSLRCAVRSACYRGSKAQSLVVAAMLGLHRLLGTWRGVTLAALTEFDRQKLLEFNALHRVFDEDRLVVRPNPVVLSDPGEVPVLNQIVYAGRLEELKGLRTVIEAWRLLEDDAAMPRLIVAGSGPLEGWAQENAGPNVTFAGRLTRDGLDQAMDQSRAVVAASLCYESFALVPAEAHGLGVPVLASDLGNVGASVKEGVDGLHFAPGDPAALADAVRALCARDWDRNAIRRAAREQYSAGESYRSLMALYGQCGK